jgi:hypothetical protein
VHQPGPSYLQQRDHVDNIILNRRAGADFAATVLPPNVNNILTHEADHWPVRRYNPMEKPHAVGLLCRRAVWEPYLVNATISWLVSLFAVSFPLADSQIVLGVYLACFFCAQAVHFHFVVKVHAAVHDITM